jgi:tetratricopeptide (TPR) repeat protein
MKALLLFAFLLFVPLYISAQAPVTITTEPNAIIWIDEIRRGTTDASGKLSLNKISAGRHSVRVRANGFKETTAPLLPGRRTLAVKLAPTTDQAELRFQEAETAREKARGDDALQKAADIYREAIKLRPAFPAANVGLARVLMDLNEFKQAHAAIDAARRTRPAYSEASAVEGRIYREEAFTDDAIRSFRRAIREGGGTQPEAFVGLARVYED